MGLSTGLIIIPLFVLTICILVSGAGGLTYAGNTSPLCVGATGTGLDCAPGATGVTYTCNSGRQCELPYSCPASPPSPTFCTYSPGGLWELPPGASILIDSSATANLGPPPNTGTSQQMIFGSINAAGFVVMIGVATAVVVIGSFGFLGSGENTEGVHIAFLVTLLLGIWAILSASEGVLTGDPSSYFIGLNDWIAGTGTTLYIFLSLLYVLGIIGSVSRGSGAGGGV